MALTAEEAAMDDVLYKLISWFLDRTSDRQQSDLAAWLRLLRDVARKQFMSKALLSKIRTEFPIIT